MALAVVALVVALPHRAAAGAPPASRLRIPACSVQRCGSVVALLQHRPASAHRAAGPPVMNAYDDYAAKIKDKLESLDEVPVVPMVPARGNDGIGGRDRSKVRQLRHVTTALLTVAAMQNLSIKPVATRTPGSSDGREARRGCRRSRGRGHLQIFGGGA